MTAEDIKEIVTIDSMTNGHDSMIIENVTTLYKYTPF